MTKTELLAKMDEWIELPLSQSPMIISQVDKFVKQHGYSYKEIGRAVFYYFLILNRPFVKTYGIGIVPSVMQDANDYFEAKKREEENLKKQGEKLAEQVDRKVIKANPKRDRRGINTIKFEDL